MDLEKKLIKLLDKYIYENNLEKTKYETNLKNKKYYERLIQLLDVNYHNVNDNQEDILSLLNQISINKEFYSAYKDFISKANDINQYINNIKNEYQKVLNDIKEYESKKVERTKLINTVHAVKNSLKYKKTISNPIKDIPNIIKVFHELEKDNIITTQEIIIYLNLLEYYNDKLLSKKDIPEEQEILEYEYQEIPNIINSGFQEQDISNVSPNRKPILDSYIIELIENIKYLSEGNINEEEIENILISSKNNSLSEDEYNYILEKTMSYYIDELIELYKLLLDREIYINKESKKELVKDYYKILNIYTDIKKYYDEYNIFIEEPESIESESKEPKRLIYSHTETNILKSRLITDMGNIPKEYYEDIYDLLDRFKKGELTNTEVKILKNHGETCRHTELKHDSIRIILKHAKDDIYIVTGVFLKKATNDEHTYKRIKGRALPSIDTDEKITMYLDLAKQVEEELYALVKEKGRKNHRG